MAIWAIADLHLSFGVPNKGMDVFGLHWVDHAQKIEKAWRELIQPEDLVLISGDISWALHLTDAIPDLEWIDKLPGTKVMIKGNHDYWWGSISKVKKVLPSSCHVIQNDAFNWNDVTIAGTRLWDDSQLSFSGLINYQQHDCVKNLTATDNSDESQKIYQRELGRLETSLNNMNSQARLKIVMTHYPPIGAEGQETATTRLLEKHQVDICVFGHLHNVKKEKKLFGEFREINYYLVACDYLENFQPLKIAE